MLFYWLLAIGYMLLRLNTATFYMVVFVVIVVERAANYWFQSVVFSNPQIPKFSNFQIPKSSNLPIFKVSPQRAQNKIVNRQ